MPNNGRAPADFESPVGRFRLLIGDTDPTEIVEPTPDKDGSGTYAFYSDAEITALVDMAGGSYKKAAIQALRLIAGSQAMLLKKFTSADLAVDGPAIADALRAVAKDLENEMAGDALAEVGTFVVPTGGTSWSGLRVLHSDETVLDPYAYARELSTWDALRYGLC